MIFGQPPNAGDRFTIEDRNLICLGNRPHITRDGREIVLIEWTGVCAQCRKDYDFATTLDTARGAKRCRACIDANPSWRSGARTPEQKLERALAKRTRNAKISASLKAHHDKRLGRNEL